MKQGKHIAICTSSALCAAALLLLLFFALRPLPPVVPAAGEAYFHFIDVGQGDCTLIRTHDGAFLIDTGPNLNEDDLLAYLYSLGVNNLTCAVFTHPHEDHIGGADAVLEALAVDTVIMPAVSGSDEAAVVYKRMADRICADTRLITVTEDTTLTFGDLTLTLMADADETQEEARGNEVSLIIRASVGDTSVLIMGDAEADAEERLVSRYAGTDTLSCQVLRVGHHGSDTSTTDALLDAVQPSYAVISAGAGNSYGHPTARVLARLSDRGVRNFRTDRDGTVILHTNGREIFPENR